MLSLTRLFWAITCKLGWHDLGRAKGFCPHCNKKIGDYEIDPRLFK